jgi:hypothetical protein
MGSLESLTGRTLGLPAGPLPHESGYIIGRFVCVAALVRVQIPSAAPNTSHPVETNVEDDCSDPHRCVGVIPAERTR